MTGALRGWRAGGALLAVLSIGSTSRTADVRRRDYEVSSAAGIKIFVREVMEGTGASDPPLVLVHGGGPGGVASFDLPVPGYSLAADLARGNRRVYVMDVRGWEGSTRPPSLDQPPDKNPPAVSAEEAARDIAAVVAWVRGRTGSRPALLGWASGGQWAGVYAAKHSSEISGLVTLNSLYGAPAAWAFSEACGVAVRDGAYRLADRKALLGRWDASIPVEPKSLWREEAVAEAYVRTAIASDPTSQQREPPSLRIPLGYFPESCRLASGQKLWSAEEVGVPILAIRGERDFWSRPEDLAALRTDAPGARTVTLPGATHHVFLDRPDRGRDALLGELTQFFDEIRASRTLENRRPTP